LIIGKYDQVIHQMLNDVDEGNSKAILALAYALKNDESRSTEILQSLDEETFDDIAKIAYFNSNATNAFYKQDFLTAKKYFTMTIKINSNDFFALRLLGNIHAIQKEYSQAVECYQQILAYDSEAEMTKYACNGIYWLQRNRKAALKMNMTMKPSLWKYIDFLVFLFFGNDTSIILFTFAWMFLVLDPYIRPYALISFFMVFLILALLSFVIKHRYAIITFTIGLAITTFAFLVFLGV
jgi:tetratricopeptide (TPR) repeat protein